MSTNQQSFIPLSDPEEEKRIQQEREEQNAQLEKDLPGSMYSAREREEYIQRRFAEQSLSTNPWDLQGRQENDKVAKPLYENL